MRVLVIPACFDIFGKELFGGDSIGVGRDTLQVSSEALV